VFRSIRWRLVLSYLFLILLTLGVVGGVILRLVEDYVQRQEREYLAATAEAVAQQAGELLWPYVRQAQLQELAETSALLGNAQVRILDSQRRVVADSDRSPGEQVSWILLPERWQVQAPGDTLADLTARHFFGGRLALPVTREEQFRILEQLPPDAPLTVLRWQERPWGGGFELEVVQNPQQLMELAVEEREAARSDQVLTVPVGEARAPLGYVEIGHGPDLGSEAVATTRKAFTYAALGAMALAIFVGLLVSRGLTAPLLELGAVASRMSGGDLSTRAPVRSRDEIGHLAGQFNQMAERLEASFAELAAERDALRRFIADASHELRTPITALKSFNELLQDAGREDPEARVEFLAESEAQIERLEWVTTHLLDLSRLDAGLVALDLGHHNAADLISSAASACKALAFENQVSLSVQAPADPLVVECDRARIELALGNLMDNACRYADGQVEIGAEWAGGAVRCWVRDDGPGIEPEDQAHIFERFFRGRAARAGDGGYEGTGLGLSIVQSIAQAHGGRVWVESVPGAGSLFVIELPMVQGALPPLASRSGPG
jgi:signal transduction histidine kinase